MLEVAWAYNNIGDAYMHWQDYENAITHFEKQIDIARQLGHVELEIYGYLNGSYCHFKAGNAEKTGTYMETAKELAEKLGHRLLIAVSHHMRGIIHGGKEEWEEAEKNFITALEIEDEIGSVYGLAQTNQDYGNMLVAKGEVEKGKGFLEKARVGYDQLKNKVKAEEVEQALKELGGKKKN